MEKSFIKYLDNYEIGLALNILEKFFWNFCDNYIEIVNMDEYYDDATLKKIYPNALKPK